MNGRKRAKSTARRLSAPCLALALLCALAAVMSGAPLHLPQHRLSLGAQNVVDRGSGDQEHRGRADRGSDHHVYGAPASM